MKKVKTFFICLTAAILVIIVNTIFTYGSILKTPGNTPGNIANSGFACEKDGWVYFSNGQSLYKSKINGTSLFKLYDDNAAYINVSGSTLYYSNGSDNHSIYTINIDGTGRKKVLDGEAAFLTVYGDWMYFTIYEDIKLYRAKTDGTLKSMVCDGNDNFLNIGDQWIYYTAEYDHGKVCRIKPDGTMKQELSINNAGCIYVKDDWIFYISYDDNRCIYKTKLYSPYENIKLTKYSTMNMNISGDFIYFIDYQNRAIHKMKIDGSGDMELNTANSSSINIAGNWLYYYNFNSWPILYKMKLNGSFNSEVEVKK